MQTVNKITYTNNQNLDTVRVCQLACGCTRTIIDWKRDSKTPTNYWGKKLYKLKCSKHNLE